MGKNTKVKVAHAPKHGTHGTANSSKQPVRGGKGATRSLDWYRRND